MFTKTVSLVNADATQLAMFLQKLYPKLLQKSLLLIPNTATNQLVIEGSFSAVLNASCIAIRSDSVEERSHLLVLRPIVDPYAGPLIAAALNTYISGGLSNGTPTSAQPPGHATDSQSGGGTGGGGAVASSSPTPTPTPTATPAPSAAGAVLLDPSQRAIVVRADARTLAQIRSTVWPALNTESYGGQTYQTYEVQFAIPNPIAPGGNLTATSTIQDLATSVQTIVNQTGNYDVRVTADPTYPRIIAAGSKHGVAQALKLLAVLDRPPALVQVEAYVYEIDENKAKDIGLELPTGAIESGVGEFSSPVAGAPATPPPVLSLQKLTHIPLELPLQLNLLLSHGAARLTSRPQIATINGRQTVIDVMTTIPFAANVVNSSGLTVSTIANYQTGTRLEVVPIINDDGYISAYVHSTYATLTGLTVQGAPEISNREAFTTFRLGSGQAGYISGLDEINGATSEQDVPGLSKLPLIGVLFRNRQFQYTRTKLFIILTATIVSAGELQTVPLDAPRNTPAPQPRQEPLPTPPPTPFDEPLPTLPPSPAPSPRATRTPQVKL